MKKVPSVRLVWDRTKQATGCKVALVQIEVTYMRSHKYISTGVHVSRDEWSGVAPRYVYNRLDADELNDTIRRCLKAVTRAIDKLMDDDVFGFTMNRLSEEIEIEKEKGQSFVQFVRKRLRERLDRSEISYGTYQAINGTMNHVERSGTLIEFSDLTARNVQLLDDYFHKIGLRQTTICKTHKRIKVYVNEALRRELIPKNPYATMKIKTGQAKPKYYLNEEEMNTVVKKKIPDYLDRLIRVRDVAVVQMYTGLAYCDLMTFDYSKVEKRKNGNKTVYFLRDSRNKTGEEYFLVLLTPVVEILTKYGWKIPRYSNQKYNRYLLELMEYCGITKPISSHDLRRTYATFALSKGVPIEIVSKNMGHASIKQTEEYARLLSKDVETAMLSLDKKIWKCK